jgi:hypothetical protein
LLAPVEAGGMSQQLTIPIQTGVHLIRIPRGRLALVVVETLGPKASRQLVERAADMIGLRVVEKDAP